MSRFVTLTALPALAAAGLINDEENIARLNRQNSTWEAGHNEFFDGMSYEDARGLLGTVTLDIRDYLTETLGDEAYAGVADESIPSDFDSRTQWPGLIHPIRNQEQCGSCWAFSAAEVLGDRVAIAKGEPSPKLSPEDLVSCDTGDMGCSGGMLPKAWDYLKTSGIVTDTCFPYAAGSGNAPSCPSKCADGENWRNSKVKARSAYAIKGVSNMQKEIMTNGPIQVAFNVYKSFMSYKKGVYKKHPWEFIPEGGHAVKMVGWGTEDGQDYWLVANSWDTTWGLKGFFKIARGDDQCGIESRGPPYAGMPETESIYA